MRQKGFAPILIILFVLITIGGAYYFWSKKVNISSTPTQTPSSNATSTPIGDNKKDLLYLCPTNIKLPTGYRIQSPLNSFYGTTMTSKNEVKICNVYLGPDYSAGYEGFSGGQIQLNAYLRETTSIKEIISNEAIKSNSSTGTLTHYTRWSYGGEDEVVLIEGTNAIFQVIWRVQPKDSNITSAAFEIVKQLQAN